MYGPKQRYRDPLEKAIPKHYQCSHTHVSGRHCTNRTPSPKSPCEMCVPVNGSAQYCRECFAMLRSFGLRAT